MTTAETLTTTESSNTAVPLRVLVAEDDPMFRKILKNWLENWGYPVTLAEDGTQAWAILQQEDQPELLILDWVMPGIDGAEICHRVRARQRTPISTCCWQRLVTQVPTLSPDSKPEPTTT
jgi:CheY-like chemotaxis protein